MVRRRRVYRGGGSGMFGWLRRWLMIDWSDEAASRSPRRRLRYRTKRKRIVEFPPLRVAGRGGKLRRLRRVKTSRESMAAFHPHPYKQQGGSPKGAIRRAKRRG